MRRVIPDGRLSPYVRGRIDQPIYPSHRIRGTAMRHVRQHLASTFVLYLAALILCLGPLRLAAQQAGGGNDGSLAALRQKAEAGDVPAEFSLGTKYYSAGDYKEALAWFGKAAQ